MNLGVKAMVKFTASSARMWAKLGTRGTVGLALLEIAELDNLMVLTADLAKTSGLERFKNAYPDKLLNMGIAEQNMICVAGGLAKEGQLVYVTTFANFAAMRSYEQVRLNLGYMKLNVKIIGIGSGLSMAMFGNTHYGIEDIALMRAIPNMTVVSPADGMETVKLILASSTYDNPMYIRLTGVTNAPIVYKEDYEFTIGKAITLREGKDITIFANGSMVHPSLMAAELLGEKGIDAKVVNMHTIKPLDLEVIKEACVHSKLIVSVEEHSVVGGLGSAISEYTATMTNKPQQLFIGLKDAFIKSGSYEFMIKNNDLTAEGIVERILETLK